MNDIQHQMGVVAIEDAHQTSERRHHHRFGVQATRQQEPWRRVRDSVVKYEVWDSAQQVRVSITFNVRTGILGVSAHSPQGDFAKVYSPGSLDKHASIAMTLCEFASALLQCIGEHVGSHGGSKKKTTNATTAFFQKNKSLFHSPIFFYLPAACRRRGWG